MAEYKGQHYLPQFYLRGFSQDEKGLWTYSRKDSRYYQQTIKDAAKVRNFYTYTNVRGEKSLELEKLFSQLEGDAVSIIDKADHCQAMTRNERALLALFCASLHLRGPKFREWHDEAISGIYLKLMKDYSYHPESIRQSMIEQGKGPTDSELVEMVEAMKHSDEEFEIGVPKEDSIRAMLNLLPKATEALLGMNWVFYHRARAPFFILPDVPFMLVPPAGLPKFQGVGYLTPGAIKIVPITRRVCLFIYDPGETFGMLSCKREQVEFVNKFSIASSHKFTFAHDEAALRKAVEDLGPLLPEEPMPAPEPVDF